MNKYKTEFFCFCPLNGIRVKYLLTIETEKTISVEDIIDEITLYERGLHEQIADQLFKTFGGIQILVANHHGVTIETTRP